MKTIKFIHRSRTKSKILARHFLSALFFLLPSCYGYAQEIKHQNVVIVNDTAVFKFQVLEGENKITTEPDVVYFWYLNSAINSTPGEYSGMLLDGEYKEYDKQEHIREQGIYRKGEKTGTWKKWSASGKMTESSHFKKEKIQNIVAEKRDTVSYPSSKEERKGKRDVAINEHSEKKIEKMSWSEKKRWWANKRKSEKVQKRNTKESGDQIRKKNKKEEKYIAVPTSYLPTENEFIY